MPKEKKSLFVERRSTQGSEKFICNLKAYAPAPPPPPPKQQKKNCLFRKGLSPFFCKSVSSDRGIKTLPKMLATALNNINKTNHTKWKKYYRRSKCRRSDCCRSNCRRSKCQRSNCRRSNCRRSKFRRSKCRRSKCRWSNCRRSNCRRSKCHGAIVAFCGAFVTGIIVAGVCVGLP